MHWDGSISVGNILTFIGIVAAILLAFNRFTVRHETSIASMTTALNNLSHITDTLSGDVKIQNGRLAKVETTLAVQDGVRAALTALGHPPA